MRLYECPLTFVAAETWEIIRLVYLMEDGSRLLYAGGWGDQPAWLVEAYEIFRRETSIEMKRERSKA